MKRTTTARQFAFTALEHAVRRGGVVLALVVIQNTSLQAQSGAQLPPPVLEESRSPHIHGHEIVDVPAPPAAVINSGIHYAPPQHADVRQHPLWSEYHSDSVPHMHAAAQSSCQCQKCCQKKSKPGKKLLGKLTHGLDVLFFGVCSSEKGCDDACGCDDSCDAAVACYDNACDAMGTFAGSAGMSAVPHAHAHKENTQGLAAPPALKTVPRKSAPAAPSEMSPSSPKTPARQLGPSQPQNTPPGGLEDPFVDDPIARSNRRGVKPTSFRR